jgi:hypothetical protein
VLAAALVAACDEETPVSAGYDQRSDPRVAPLFQRCVNAGYYDRSVADPIPILVEKLERSAREPLTRAKEELAAAGAAAIPELRRLVQRHFTEPHGAPYLANALDVLKLNPAEEAHDVLVQCLQHPSDAIRLSAIQALQLTHARPEDFELLKAHLDIEKPEQRHQVAIALHSADAARAEALYLDWIEKGERSGMHRFVLPLLARSTLPATARRAGELYRSAEPTAAAYLAAPAARAGDADARAFLEEQLARREDEVDRQLRISAVSALIEAEMRELLIDVLTTDPDGNLRTLAVGALASAEDLGEKARAALSYGLDDLKPAVRAACLNELVARGDAAAIDRALSLLQGTPGALQDGMAALVRRMPEDPATAERVYDALRTRDDLESFLELRERTATLKSIGQVPTARAAEHLRELGLEHAEEQIERLPAHEWLMIQAANTGPEGRAWLREELAAERHPRRRLDLLWAGTGARTDAVRGALHALVEDASLSPEERIFACERLLTLGPAGEVAGRLKRLAPRLADEGAQVALQCLLWTWY